MRLTTSNKRERERELVDRLHSLGLSISYDHLLRMSSGVANRLCTQYDYDRDGVVCLPQLRKGVFTTGQADNTDRNPSSVSAKDSFHGTAHSHSTGVRYKCAKFHNFSTK